MARTALILGAGLGGLVAAETLRKLLPDTDRVIAVDRAAPSRIARLENSKPSESIWEGDRDDIFKIDWMEGWPDRQDSH